MARHHSELHTGRSFWAGARGGCSKQRESLPAGLRTAAANWACAPGKPFPKGNPEPPPCTHLEPSQLSRVLLLSRSGRRLQLCDSALQACQSCCCRCLQLLVLRPCVLRSAALLLLTLRSSSHFQSALWCRGSSWQAGGHHRRPARQCRASAAASHGDAFTAGFRKQQGQVALPLRSIHKIQKRSGQYPDPTAHCMPTWALWGRTWPVARPAPAAEAPPAALLWAGPWDLAPSRPE